MKWQCSDALKNFRSNLELIFSLVNKGQGEQKDFLSMEKYFGLIEEATYR